MTTLVSFESTGLLNDIQTELLEFIVDGIEFDQDDLGYFTVHVDDQVLELDHDVVEQLKESFNYNIDPNDGCIEILNT